MKTSFEIWLANNVEYSNARNLLNEAIVCYKASANKAALLLSYISFIDVIRKRLLEAKKPDDISEGEWNQKRKYLLDDDEAEKAVFDILNRTDGKYFKISDSLRVQIRYWRDRRNDCAHLKNNPIDTAHVEAFWLFIMSNINKISVIGSQTDLMNRFIKHFDETYTPLGSDYSSLVLDIPNSVELVELDDFLVQLKNHIKKIIDEGYWFYCGEDANLFYYMLRHLEGDYYESVKRTILSDQSLINEMFNYCPEFLTHFKNNSDLIRKLWMKNLGEVRTPRVACTLLRNSIIPTKEIKEFIKHCVFNSHDIIPNEEELIFLEPYGYNEKIIYIFKTALTSESAFAWWTEKNEKFIKFFIKYNIQNKNQEFVKMCLAEYPKQIKSKQRATIYSTLSTLIEDEVLAAFVKQCAAEISFDLEDITFMF